MPITAASTALTNFTLQDPTVYKSNIDADFASASRTALAAAPRQSSTPIMKVAVNPLSLFNPASGVLTEVGAYTVGSTTNTSTSVTVANPAGISNGMLCVGPGIPAGTTATISGVTVTLSNAATATATAAQLIFLQLSATITAPVSNPRIDRIVVDQVTGLVSVITGTAAPTPTAPAITAGKLPVAQVLLQTTSTSIVNSMITDERNIMAAGLGTSSAYAVGTSGATIPLNNGNNTESGNNSYTGSNDFTAGSILAPTRSSGDTTTNVATTAFLNDAIANQRYTSANATGTTSAYAVSLPNLGSLVGNFTRIAIWTSGVGTNTVAGPSLSVNGGTTYQIYSGAAPYALLPIGQLPFYADLFFDGAAWLCMNPGVTGAPTLGAISGFVPSSIGGSNTTALLATSAGQATDSTGAVIIARAAASWAVSNGNAINGYQGGTTLPNSSAIHFYVCSGSSGTGIFASLSATAPTLPSGYNTSFRRIFSINTNSSGALLAGTFTEVSGGALYCSLATRTTEYSGGGSTTALSTTLTGVPASLKMEANITVSLLLSNGTVGNTYSMLISDLSDPDVASSTGLCNAGATGNTAGGAIQMTNGTNIRIMTNTSAQIRQRCSQTGAAITITSNGFTDFRRT